MKQIHIPSDVDQICAPAPISEWIKESKSRIEQFQDCWRKTQIEQFVPADYELVCQSLLWLRQSQPLDGNRFLEWGCGFAIVSAIAYQLGFDVVGIEAELDLITQGRQTMKAWEIPIELFRGNFLPPGAEGLADDPTHPSLGHDVPCGYAAMDSELDDFSVVYSYPWPGEDEFHADVFEKYARRGAYLMMFCGPNDVRLFCK